MTRPLRTRSQGGPWGVAPRRKAAYTQRGRGERDSLCKGFCVLAPTALTPKGQQHRRADDPEMFAASSTLKQKTPRGRSTLPRIVTTKTRETSWKSGSQIRGALTNTSWKRLASCSNEECAASAGPELVIRLMRACMIVHSATEQEKKQQHTGTRTDVVA